MPTPSLPRSLADLLIAFGPCFTQPTMRTFQALVGGFLAWPGQRTVTGMLAGAGLAGRRHHDLGYRFFSTARWCPDQLGLILLDLITAMLVPAGAPVVLAGRRHPLAPHRPKAARRGLAPRRQRPRPPPPRLGPPLGRGRRHRPPAVPAPGGVPARPGAAVAPRRPRPHPAAAGPRTARPGYRPPRRPADPPGRRRRLHRQAAPRAAHPRHRDRAAPQRRRPAPAPATPNRPPRPPPRQRRPAPGADHARRHDPLPMDPPHRALLRQAGAPGGPGDQLPASGTARSKANPSRSCSAVRSAPPTATSWPWSPPTLPPPPSRSSNATATAGPKRWSFRNWQKRGCGPSGAVGSA